MMHKQFLLAALAEALLGQGACSPNPSVGAVAVQYGKIIAQSFHKGAGTAHAESLVLAQFPPNTPDVILYVTLEPCNHWGKTPPCVDAIIQHGIACVVYGYQDPNLVVRRNNTPQKLHAAGIEVIYHPLPDIDLFYRSYNHWIKYQMPWVTAKIAHTFDGKIALAGGVPLPLSNAGCEAFTHQQRARTDVILTTARTINQDNPAFTARLPGIVMTKPLAILDTQILVNQSARIFENDKPRYLYHDDALCVGSFAALCQPRGVSTCSGRLDLHAVLLDLGRLGYHDVWVEAGGILFSALHAQNLVNQTYIYWVPKVLGERAVSAYHAPSLFEKEHTIQWRAMEDNMIATILWE